ncbi:hypothetical protein [Campylobacter mucosalis]|uniref:Uncharacterized protein n=1 Tax=Campylobacter mucosalis CCUG 21559 TaxID=1032067 RepID=A0A6G5QFI0_9BACT|nr:hypothetical protein [Campylobacter mucosalis]QCD44430.1 hypothetical protein CMUC_0631 [Campylobacter mucosalis CCUG 21559]
MKRFKWAVEKIRNDCQAEIKELKRLKARAFLDNKNSDLRILCDRQKAHVWAKAGKAIPIEVHFLIKSKLGDNGMNEANIHTLPDFFNFCIFCEGASRYDGYSK